LPKSRRPTAPKITARAAMTLAGIRQNGRLKHD
jgi:hypothetical protein